MDRRQLLRTGAVAVLAAAAGCRPPASDPDAAAPAGRDREVSDGDGLDGEVLDGPGPDDGAPAPPADEAPVRRIEVICRDALGLAAAGAGARPHRIERLTLHHTAVRLEDDRLVPQRLRRHQRFHQDQGWPDIAYHYAVDRRGNVYELRSPDTAGDTFTAYDPAGHYLVVCEGDYDVDQPTDLQLASIAAMFAHASQRYGVSADTLTGHRDHAATRCPGDNLYARLPDLRQEIARLAGTDSLALTSVCGEEGRDRVAAIEAG